MSTRPVASRSPVPLVLIVVGILGGTGLAGWWFLRGSGPAESQPDAGVFSALGSHETRTSTPGQPPSTDPEAVARRLKAEGDTAATIVALRQAVSQDPENDSLYAALSDALHQSGDDAGALEALAEAARLAPSRHKLRYAQNLSALDQEDAARRAFDELMEDGEAPVAVKEAYGRFLYGAGDYAGAAPLLEAAVAGGNSDPVVKQDWAVALELTGRKGEAKRIYRELVSSEPRAHAARERLAGLLAADGETKAAEEVLREGLESAPGSPVLVRGLGGVLEASGRPAEAAAEYERYLDMVPDGPDAADIRARADRLKGEKPK